MLNLEPKTKSLQELTVSLQDWLTTNYLSGRMTVSNGQILIYSRANSGLPIKIISIIIFLAIPVVLILRLLLSSNAGFDEKVLIASIAILYLLFMMIVIAKGGQTILTISLNKGTVKTEKTGAILKRFNISTEINLKEISKVELWQNPPYPFGASAFNFDLTLTIWAKNRRVELLYFPKGGPYGDLEPYIATQVKNLVDAAIRDCSAKVAPLLNT